MSQLNNDALLEILSEDGWPQGDEFQIFSGAGTTQAAGLRFKSASHRVVKNLTANAAIVLGSIQTGEAPSMAWLINDSGNTVNVFCAPGENMNGVANSSFAVTAGNAAVLFRVPMQIKRKGGTSGGGSLNWSAALLT
jgi:hypothetical protein